jgi:hypothetical protein
MGPGVINQTASLMKPARRNHEIAGPSGKIRRVRRRAIRGIGVKFL